MLYHGHKLPFFFGGGGGGGGSCPALVSEQADKQKKKWISKLSNQKLSLIDLNSV